MNTTAGWAYFDPEFDGLSERLYGPLCRVTIDNDSLEDCTVIKIDSVKKQRLLLEAVQVLTDMNLTILKGYISSDAGWFMDVFNVKDETGKKITDKNVINYIQQAIGANRETTKAKFEGSNGPSALSITNQFHNYEQQPRAIEMTGRDRPGLFSEISAALADLGINVVEAHAWTHNSRLACVAYISDQHQGSPIDNHRLAAIEDHLTTVLRATTCQNTAVEDSCTIHHQQFTPKTTSTDSSATSSPDRLIKNPAADTDDGGETATSGSMMTDVERRLHQLMLSVRDFDRPTSSWMAARKFPEESGSSADDDEDDDHQVSVESCDEKGYSIVTVSCKDRRRLMFDTVCTLTDMQYVIFHASVDSRDGYAFQEYFIRHADGRPLNTDGEKERVKKCLQAAIERRVCDGVRLELCARNRVGLLSDITRVLRENGLAVVRADIETQGEKAVNAFYVRDMSGKNVVDMGFIKSMKREMGAIDLAVKDETQAMTSSTARPTSSTDVAGNINGRPRFSIGDILRSQIGRFSNNFVAIR